MIFSIELILMMISIIMMGIILFTLYRFRKVRGVIYLIGLVVCRIIFASSVILEKSSYLLTEMIIFRNIQQTSLCMMVPFFILFVYRLISHQKVKKIQWEIPLFSIFIIWILLIWFDSYLHIVYYTNELVDGRLMRIRTIYANVFNIFCYSSLAVCIYLLFRYVWLIRNDFRRPGIVVLLLCSLPLIFEIIRFSQPQWSTWLGTLSVFCAMTGMIIILIILRTKFFSIIPIAKNIVFDSFPECIVIMNASGKIIEGNQKAVQFFAQLGYSVFYDKPISQLLKQWPEWYSLSQSLQQGSVDINVWLNKEKKIYRVNVYPLRTLGEQGQGSVSLIIDITEQQGHLEKIAHLNKLKDQLFTVVSHDIRSPLAMQYQLIELLEEDLGSFGAEHQEIIIKLGEQIRHTLGMSNNLLEWFRSQREDVVLYPQLLELSEIVEDCHQLLAIHSGVKSLHITNNIVKDTYVCADREVVLLVIRNLLSNAIKFTQVGGTIQVGAQYSGEMVIVSVRDNGVGMDNEQIERLFNENQMYSSMGTAGEKGAGLGLLVSKQFVQLSGESMWVESVVGQGSVFYFTLRGGESGEGSYCR
ncbi:ATP-binding protein [Lysinibacillus sp. NPDC047702]|uniref:ATP-binding protein n=1 Tax=unclassified Lysinibacillus TaxID=2636778 RepID=UPI003D051A23